MSGVGRFQLLETQQLQLPHKCAVCGGTGLSEKRKFIDFDLWIEYFGVVYICDQCFIGAADIVECVPKSIHDTATQQLREAQEVIRQLINENGELRDAIDTLRNLSNTSTNFISDYRDTYSVSEERSNEDSIGVTEREERSIKSADEQGSTLIHSDDNSTKSDGGSTIFAELGLNI